MEFNTCFESANLNSVFFAVFDTALVLAWHDESKYREKEDHGQEWAHVQGGNHSETSVLTRNGKFQRK